MPNTGHAAREAEFTDFARARMPQLYRAAWLLCGERQRAEDLVQETLTKVYGRWGLRSTTRRRTRKPRSPAPGSASSVATATMSCPSTRCPTGPTGTATTPSG